MEKSVIKRDGTKERFQTKKIVNAIFSILEGFELNDDYEIVYKILKELELKIPEEITTEELDILVLKAIEMLIPNHYIYDTLAARQLLKIINRKVDKRFKAFRDFIDFGVKEKLLNENIKSFNIAELESSIDYSRDDLLDYFGLATLKDRYCLKDFNLEILEKPQWFFMRVALGIGNTDREVLDVYNKISLLEYLHSTPTLYNSATTINQYSSCYINVVEDSLNSIMDKLKEVANLSKYAGGVGTDITRLRSTGSKIYSLNAASSGIIPFIKIFDTTINAIQQGGRRRSSEVIYIQPWHLDIEAFLDLKETTGNHYLRTPSLNTALWMPDEMMRRIVADDLLYFFDPADCPELITSTGEEFRKIYMDYIKKAEEGHVKRFKKMKGREFFSKYLHKLAKTGHPWLTFKDRHNENNPCKEYGVINSSNLCTEISIPNSADSTAVCTLASVNLAKHIDKLNMKIEWIKLKETIETMVVALDNILDKNFYPSREAEKNTRDLRPIGIGIMGFADMLQQLKIPYDSEEAKKIAKDVAKFMNECAFKKSEEQAGLKGAFPHYIEMANKGKPYNFKPRRNAVLLAIAPTASIATIAGTTSAIDSQFNNIYSKDTLSGKFLVINKHLMRDLERNGLLNDNMLDQLKRANGSLKNISELMGVINIDVYKTAYEISPYKQIDIAAIFQQFIDQAVSKSLYISGDLRDKIEEIYIYAWEKGLKSTYYCFIDKLVKGEKYTTEVNKRGERYGFGKILQKNHTNYDEVNAIDKYGEELVDMVKTGKIKECPIDPVLSKICPSCE